MQPKWTLGVLLLVAVVMVSVAAPAEALPSRRTYEFYAYTYGDGDPVHNSVCPCQIGPCPPIYEAVGGYTLECDGTRTDEWGYTGWNGQCGYQNHPVDRVLVSVEECPWDPYQLSAVPEDTSEPDVRTRACDME